MNEQQRKAMVRETFDTVAEGYDNRPLRFFPESAKHLAACLDPRGGEQVLDVVTGTGRAVLAVIAIALGHRGPDSPQNTFRSTRRSVGEVIRFSGI
jgi:ubiquinone/menaquinone biosynthesis C-methylase UbiE